MKPAMTERRVSLLCGLFATVGPISLSLYTPALPEIAAALAAPISDVQLSISLFFAGFAGAQLICGPLSDALGRRPVLLLFLTIYLAGCVVALSAQTAGILMGARLLQGVGAAVGVALSRAIVRDMFGGAQAARVLALVSIMLAIGPAFAPFLGGLVLGIAGWRAIFLGMLLLGVAAALAAWLLLRETVVPDLSRLQPRRIARTYLRILGEPRFLFPAVILACTNGVVYAQATVLPFVMIDQVGMRPEQFGLSMVLQTGSFLIGSVVARRALAATTPARLMKLGLACYACGAAAMPLLWLLYGPTFWGTMGPIGVCGLGMAFTMPTTTATAMTPFTLEAGAASAVIGFIQMGIGFLGGLVATLFADPGRALVSVTPMMMLCAVGSWIALVRLPTVCPRHPALQESRSS